MNRELIRRGDMFYADLDPVVGSEQGDFRPVLVVQNNTGNSYSPTVVVVPITCNLNKKSLPTHVVIPQSSGLEKDSLALVEQIRTIDRSRIGGYIGHIDDKAQAKINSALLVCVGIEGHQAKKSEMLILSLCPRCENDFRNSGYVLVKKGWQETKEDCDFCHIRKGLNFGVFGTV